MNDYLKRDKYAYLMKKLEKATREEYYYEAIFIEYAIIEDRTESILRHAQIKTLDPRNNKTYTLNKKLKIIKSRKTFNTDKYILKHFTEELILNVINWKNLRNELIHNLVNTSYENEEIKNIALQGECLVKRLNNKTQLINKHLDKLIQKS